MIVNYLYVIPHTDNNALPSTETLLNHKSSYPHQTRQWSLHKNSPHCPRNRTENTIPQQLHSLKQLHPLSGPHRKYFPITFFHSALTPSSSQSFPLRKYAPRPKHQKNQTTGHKVQSRKSKG